MRFLKNGVVAFLALVIAALLLLGGCSTDTSNNSAVVAAATTSCDVVAQELSDAQAALAEVESSSVNPDTPDGKAKETRVEEAKALVAALEQRADECEQPTPTPEPQPADNATGPAAPDSYNETDNGTVKTASDQTFPIIGQVQLDGPDANSTSQGGPTSTPGLDHLMQNWQDVLDYGSKQPGYLEAVSDLGVGLTKEEIERFAKASEGVDLRAVIINGWPDISDAEAKATAKKAEPNLPDSVPVFRIPWGSLNSRYYHDDKGVFRLELPGYFPSRNEAVRIALLRPVLDSNGKIAAIADPASGTAFVYVDCGNVVKALLEDFTLTPKRPIEAPPGTTVKTTPPTPEQPTPTPTEPETEPKAPKLDPVYHNPGNGGDRNEDPDTGDFIPPQDMGQAPATQWNNPAPPPPAPAPKPTAGPALEIPLAPAPPPEQEAPTPDNPATGCVPAPGEDSC